jgi:hypothetical protein
MKRKKVNCHDKLVKALCSGPKTREQLIELVGKGFASRVSEYNKVHGYPIAIKNINGEYCLAPVNNGIDIPGKKAYPGYHIAGPYLYPKKQIEMFGRRIDNL